MNINWKKKLSSRKFWAALVAFVGTLCVVLGFDQIGTEKVCAMVSALGVLAVYILTEGYVDAKKSENQEKTEE